jgi:hypothetical protein
MRVLAVLIVLMSGLTYAQEKKECININICACKDKKCMIFPSTCLPEGWKYSDFEKCENKDTKIKIPMH